MNFMLQRVKLSSVFHLYLVFPAAIFALYVSVGFISAHMEKMYDFRTKRYAFDRAGLLWH
jgi:hypothetical protein